MDRNETYAAISEALSDRFYGKYRGEVVANADPQARGRIQVRVPEIQGENVIRWALPSVPYAGNGVGFFAMPPVGANVWVEFEAGNLRYPIWSGCFWAQNEIPAADAVPEVIFLKTASATLRIDDMAGEVRIETNGAKITLSAGEIKIEAPQITNSANGGQTKLTAGGFDAQQGAFKVV
jgi:uncharacterized protein involved in type VI secretion and phage assembly